MPELPDITIYLERLEALIVGRPLERLDVRNAFVLRSVAPSPAELSGRRVRSLRRMGKRIVIGFEGDVFAVIHLMIAGRLRWRATGKKSPGKIWLAAFVFEHGTLYLTEAGSSRRASLHLVAGEDTLAPFERGGLEPLAIDRDAFAARLVSENHTLKRALTDPRLFSGIGNAYSDEILHRARLSPLTLTSRLSAEEIGRLYAAVRDTLGEWTARLRAEIGDGFPEEVTAFRPEFAVHGKFGRPCPVCDAPVQRIRYATNETNYCARCQTGGRLLADRALSRLLRQDWPRSIDE
ncbi:MAG: formamidopyrimidine-DNA glycosylase [Gemmatimonadaceae bacterium]|nr:formamidopyrimidine-DNA glycosylase [Gemmatimonadaceae bacterium]NUQ91436.1 formamidopyrimidine-DNA glycosylase [Gemmatimonadaceae bacterium]NUR20274.1 formamidopyrimidine-DNA glycosylase [Gemmatimonadaceae bacterium]NUS97913.1 formamidopyrimidine-DNA glycosylase [Gemmatimonadaceae bacterium]